MLLNLIRIRRIGAATIGKMFINGGFECWTLEDAYHEQKVPHETCIPMGAYRIDVRTSPRFTPIYGHKMLWVKDVPGFEYILIHRGNTVSDTSGCILVGADTAGSKLLRSTEAYDKFYNKVAPAVNAGEIVMLGVIDLEA